MKRPPGYGTKLFWAVSCALFAAACLVGAVWVQSRRNGDFESSGARVGAGVFLAVLGLSMGFLAYFLYRKARPRRARHLQIAADRENVRRGETLGVTLHLLNPAKVGDALELGLVCTEYYDVEVTNTNQNGTTTRSRQTKEAAAHEDWRPVPSRESHQTFSFTVPAEAPFSYDGECLSFTWQVVARQPVRLRFDPTLSHEIGVAP